MDDLSTPPAGLLVTGLPRSGTSWVGKMLEASGEVVYVNEPLNPRRPPGRSPGVLNADVAHRYQYICRDNEECWRRAFTDTLALRYNVAAELRRNHRPGDLARFGKYAALFTLGRLRGRRCLLDDPYAILSVGWFADRMDIETLVLVRDPVAFAGSWRKLGWVPDFKDLLGQPLLMRDLLGPYEVEMRAADDETDDIVKTSLLWRITYGVIHGVRSRRRLHIRRYEDLAGSPAESFRAVYGTMGLSWTARAERRVRAATSGVETRERDARKSFAWSLRNGPSRTAFRPMDSKAALAAQYTRLAGNEIARVRELTAEVAKLYYPEF